MSTTNTGLTKAQKDEAKTVIAGLATSITDSFGKLGKILGVEEAEELGDGKPQPIDPKEKGTENKQKAVTLTEDDIQKRIDEGIDKGMQQILKAMSGADDCDDDEEADTKKPPKAKKAAGVGDRTDLPTVVAGGGPVIKVMPITKAQDSTTAPAAGTTAPEPVDIAKALSGDRSEAIKLMKSATPQAEVPATLIDVLGKRFSG